MSRFETMIKKENEQINKMIHDACRLKNIEINQLKAVLVQQCQQIKKFGEELQIFKKNKQNIFYERKLKKYRDEIVELKKQLSQKEA